MTNQNVNDTEIKTIQDARVFLQNLPEGKYGFTFHDQSILGDEPGYTTIKKFRPSQYHFIFKTGDAQKDRFLDEEEAAKLVFKKRAAINSKIPSP